MTNAVGPPHLRPLFIAALLATTWGCGDDAHEDFESLSAALEGAAPGSTVHVASVRIEATRTLIVPEGVTLVGESGTVIVAPSDSVGIVVRANNTVETRVTNVSVESRGTAGIVAVGAGGTARLDRVSVVSELGIGIGAEGLDVFILEEVTLTGPVTPDNADDMPIEPAPNDTATHGVVVVDVGDVRMLDVRVDSFAQFGALFVNSDATWREGGADNNLGTGVMVSGGTATFERLQICGSLQGVRLMPSYGTVFANAASVGTSEVAVCDGDGYGMLHAGAVGMHANLLATGNDNAAVWIQDNPAFDLTGASSMVSNNYFAGIVSARSQNVTISDATVQNTRLALRLAGTVGSVQVGDGVQVLGMGTDAVSLTGLSLVDNERTGFLADLATTGSTDALSISGVTATATGTATGAIAQNGTVNAGWDSGITRAGAAATNDAAFAGVYDIVGVVAPTDMPATDTIATMGLDAVGVVAPTD